MKQTFTITLVAICLILPQIALAEHDQEMKGFRHELKQKKMEHWKTQKGENKEFRKTLKQLPPEERAKAVIGHRQTQYSENKTFREQRHKENMDFLKAKLEHNKKLSDAQKTELINFFENQYQENTSFREKQHAENIAFLQSIADNPNLTQEQRKQSIREHFQTQKVENKDFWSKQRAERKELKHSLHSSSAPHTSTTQ